MARMDIYVKDKIEKEIRDIYLLDIQNGASPSEVSLSSTCNELLRLGLIMHKAKNTEDTFNQREFNRELLRKVSGSKEGIMILLTMMTELYVNSTGGGGTERIDSLLSQYLTEIDNSESEADSRHFIKPDESE
ncbi:relaxosome protein TraM [Pantoea vagans]|uniref:relaxosome protein TraM n=1 Tax=Pantoea vagans TaxID=470934 RepID=UPI0023AEC21F|nr:relaxosome protein TraM [Pantoea vagans]MDE8559225.1 relaxosome protein TraM [Pantoea vagans]MDE8579225.1 relaxosome protein TraM [Pantoea vagans]